MSSDDYQQLCDVGLGALIAYARSAPPQESSLPPNELRLFGHILPALGQLPILIAFLAVAQKFRKVDFIQPVRVQ